MFENRIHPGTAIHEEDIPIHVNGFVPHLLHEANLYLKGRTNPLYLFNFIHPVISAFNKMKQSAIDRETTEAKVTYAQQTEAFNELLIAFNLVWNGMGETVVRKENGLYVVNKLEMGPNETVFEAQYIPDFYVYVDEYNNFFNAYMQQNRYLTTVPSFYHEIDMSREYAAVGVSEKKYDSDMWNCNLIGIETVGRGVEASYRILQRNFITKVK